MALPASFRADGFFEKQPPFRGLLIGTEGRGSTGKSEFGCSGPGPGIGLMLDRNYQGMLNNPEPPPTRQADFVCIPVKLPLESQLGAASDYLPHWKRFYNDYYVKALDNKDARTVLVDGDSDGFELQTLAAFGKLTQIPPILRTQLNAARRAYMARAVDSGKIVIMTNKVKRKYENKYDAAGRPVIGTDGKEVRDWDGKSYERAGWSDHEYGYELQLKHIYDEKKKRFGVQLLLCKPNRDLDGQTLWGDECNLPTLLQFVYPHIDLAEWGY